jgi:hypothetical protein
MYEVINDDYPTLEAYLCYECGFQTNTTLMNEKGLHQVYQNLFMHAKDILKPKRMPRPRHSPTESQQRKETTDDSTEPLLLYPNVSFYTIYKKIH